MLWSDVKTAYQKRLAVCAQRALVVTFSEEWDLCVAPIIRGYSETRPPEEKLALAAAQALYCVNERDQLVYEDGSSWESIRNLHETLNAFHLFFDDVARRALALEVIPDQAS